MNEFSPSELPADLIEKLEKDFPKELIEIHPAKTYLSTIKAAFVLERLNECFGIGQWTIDTEVVELCDDGVVIVKGTMRVPKYGIKIEQFGGHKDQEGKNKKSDRTDSYKGAATSALKKCASYLGIGKSIYQGMNSDSLSAAKSRKYDQSPTPSPTNSPTTPASGNCQDCGAKKITSQKGNLYCSAKCWLNKK